MTETEVTGEKQRQDHLFKPGTSGNPAGRPKGARSKLGETFLEDLRDAWNEHGAAALRQCATESPEQFCKIVAGLLPRDFNLNIAVDVGDFATKFRTACAMLGNTEPSRLRRPLPGQRVIEHDDGR